LTPGPNGVPRPDDHVIVLFGATGDLAKRKILPGLYHLSRAGLLPRRYRIIGSSPAAFGLTEDEFRDHALDAVRTFGTGRKPGAKAWASFASCLSFAVADEGDADDLVAAVDRAERAIGGNPRRLYHLAIPPAAFPGMVEMLGASGLSKNARVIVEKPFGTDLTSARELNATVHRVFDESQVFRIDHFLGKESVDNILSLRFANGFLEPVWNRVHIDAVQIDVPERLSIEGRAAFYDETGAFRDMIVTHLFQVLGFVAMEPPAALDADSLRAEKTKVFKSMRPLDPARVVRGQYRGYKREKGVPRSSDTETLAAVEVRIDNWRWDGVPFYLRSGKSMAEGRQLITLLFRKPPVGMLRGRAAPRLTPNELVIDFADPGSISMEFLVKEPGPGPVARLEAAEMQFSYKNSFYAANELEGYEHLILEAMLGNQMLFTTAEGIERLWEISMPLLEHPPPAQPYAPGTWGPKAVEKLIAPRSWHLH
jgi:glucose-6-phosphate 1-dehydrogenase